MVLESQEEGDESLWLDPQTIEQISIGEDGVSDGGQRPTAGERVDRENVRSPTGQVSQSFFQRVAVRRSHAVLQYRRR